MDRYAKALWAYSSTEEGTLSFPAGALIKLINFNKDDEWWGGEYADQEGLFPANYVKKLPKNSPKVPVVPVAKVAVDEPVEEVKPEEDDEFYPYKVINDREEDGVTLYEVCWKWRRPAGRTEPATTWVPGFLIVEHGAQNLLDEYNDSRKSQVQSTQETQKPKAAGPKLLPDLPIQKQNGSAKNPVTNDNDVADDDDVLLAENETLRNSTVKLIETIKELKATEKLHEEKITLLTQLLDEAQDDADKFAEENEQLRKSTEALVAKMHELKESHAKQLATSTAQVATLTESNKLLSEENASLRAELDKMKNAAANPQIASPQVPTPVASTPTKTSRWGSALKSIAAASATANGNSSPSTASPVVRPPSFANISKAASSASPSASISRSALKPSASSSNLKTPTKWGSIASSALSKVRANALASLSIEEDVKQAYQKIRADGEPINWAFFGYDDTGKSLTARAEGSNGITGFIAHLKPDERGYGFLRVIIHDSRSKFIFVIWCGERVSPLKKARMSTDRGLVKEVIRDFAIEVFATTLDDLKEDVIMQRVIKASGANYGSY